MPPPDPRGLGVLDAGLAQLTSSRGQEPAGRPARHRVPRAGRLLWSRCPHSPARGQHQGTDPRPAPTPGPESAAPRRAQAPRPPSTADWSLPGAAGSAAGPAAGKGCSRSAHGRTRPSRRPPAAAAAGTRPGPAWGGPRPPACTSPERNSGDEEPNRYGASLTRSHSWFQNSSKRGRGELTFEGRVLTQQQLCP